jgi:hypothetical protein
MTIAARTRDPRIRLPGRAEAALHRGSAQAVHAGEAQGRPGGLQARAERSLRRCRCAPASLGPRTSAHRHSARSSGARTETRCVVLGMAGLSQMGDDPSAAHVVYAKPVEDGNFIRLRAVISALCLSPADQARPDDAATGWLHRAARWGAACGRSAGRGRGAEAASGGCAAGSLLHLALHAAQLQVRGARVGRRSPLRGRPGTHTVCVGMMRNDDPLTPPRCCRISEASHLARTASVRKRARVLPRGPLTHDARRAAGRLQLSTMHRKGADGFYESAADLVLP